MEQASIHTRTRVRERKFILTAFPSEIKERSRTLRIVEAHFHDDDVVKMPRELLAILRESLNREDYAEMLRSGRARIRVELDGFKPYSSVRIGSYPSMRKVQLPYRYAKDFFDATQLQVSKFRHVVDGFRIDVFRRPDGEVVIMAESDQPSNSPKLEVPDWLQPYCMRDVTDQAAYYHDHIVIHGLPPR